MAITRVKTSSILQNFPKERSMLAGNDGDTGAYESIETITLSFTQTSITFSNIPSGYQHLQLRYFARTGGSGTGGENIYLRLNGNTTTSNYARHDINGNGTSAYAQGGTSVDFYPLMSGGNQLANTFTVGIIDFLDYTNTNKNKTMRILGGYDINGAGHVHFTSMLFLSTSAITSIYMSNWANSFVSGSHFALYGIR